DGDGRAAPGDERLVDLDDDGQPVQAGEEVLRRSAAGRAPELGDERGGGGLVQRRTAGGVEGQAPRGLVDEVSGRLEPVEIEEERIVTESGKDPELPAGAGDARGGAGVAGDVLTAAPAADLLRGVEGAEDVLGRGRRHPVARATGGVEDVLG